MEEMLNRIKDRILEKDCPIKTLKGLSEAIGMSEGGFYIMFNRGTMKVKTKEAICDALKVGRDYFDKSDTNKEVFGANLSDISLQRFYSQLEQMKTVFEEQLKVKDKQLEAKDNQLEAKDNQINTLLNLLGKIEGVIGRPLFSEVELLELGIVLP